MQQLLIQTYSCLKAIATSAIDDLMFSFEEVHQKPRDKVCLHEIVTNALACFTE